MNKQVNKKSSNKNSLEKHIQKVSKEFNKHLCTKYYFESYKKSVLSIMIEQIRLKNKPTTSTRHSISLIKEFGYDTLRKIASAKKMPLSSLHAKLVENQKNFPYHASIMLNKRKYYYVTYLLNNI